MLPRSRLPMTLLLLSCLVGIAPARAQQITTDSGIFASTLAEADARTPNISTAELRRILSDGGAVVLDNRPPLEYALGHIPGALNVAPKPGMPMSAYTSDVAEVGRLVGGDTTRSIVLYCNGPFCGKSRRVATDLLAAGYDDVRRYQLGAPVWRALGGVMVIEPEGVRHVFEHDRTAVLVDARSAEASGGDAIPGAVNIASGEVAAAKDDGRLPMLDHNTRLVVVGEDVAQARSVAEELTRNAFHNVAYFEGGVDAVRSLLPATRAGAVRVVRTADVQLAGSGELTQETVHDGPHMTSRILRLGPGAAIAEHHHPSHAETFVVQSGAVRLSLDGQLHELRAGDVVYIPAATTISGQNHGAGEAFVVVTWASDGRPGPLTVPGGAAP